MRLPSIFQIQLELRQLNKHQSKHLTVAWLLILMNQHHMDMSHILNQLPPLHQEITLQLIPLLPAMEAKKPSLLNTTELHQVEFQHILMRPQLVEELKALQVLSHSPQVDQLLIMNMSQQLQVEQTQSHQADQSPQTEELQLTLKKQHQMDKQSHQLKFHQFHQSHQQTSPQL